ncbi:aldehyde dehydrogenase family protein [Microbacterium soli]|uniref:Aldehyde dehydrogenase family protein n=1 Tax=Microbacterium soli TaxID=446075 RepID=A0ABP7MVG5_9MICO
MMNTSDTRTPVRRGHLIDGRIVPGDEAETFERWNPASGVLIARYARGTRDDVDDAVAAARRAFDSGVWSDMDGMGRMRILTRLANLMTEHREELARLDADEGGKPLRVAMNDTGTAIALMEFAAGLASTDHGDIHTNLGTDFTGLLVREPIGVVGAIVPWNFPLLILCQKVAFALAAGCAVVVKPSEFTSGSALRLAELALDAGVPVGVFNVVTGEGETGQALAEHLDVDMITFTGSTATGRRVLEASKTNLKKTSLELGGKASQIVFADADLDAAVEGVVFGATHNQGECCVAGARLLVQSTIAEEFDRRLVERTRRLRVGGAEIDADYGAMIHERHLENVLQAVEHAREDGAVLLTGGTRLEDPAHAGGLFLSPTVLADVAPETDAFQKEIFGPVLTVTTFDTAEEAVQLANGVAYGLANTIWTSDLGRALTVMRRLRSGTVYVNTTIDGSPQLSFGGYKASGHGREMGRAGFEEFTQLKAVQIRTGDRSGTFGLRD